jgi:hypothetical protein
MRLAFLRLCAAALIRAAAFGIGPYHDGIDDKDSR